MQQTPVSISPSGEQLPLPTSEEYKAEFERLQTLVAEQRKSGKEVVVVVGLRFVGAVMAAVVADATDKGSRTNLSSACSGSARGAFGRSGC